MDYDEKYTTVKNYDKNPPKETQKISKAKEELNISKEQYDSKNKSSKLEIQKILKKHAQE
jgi:hypothetical protein